MTCLSWYIDMQYLTDDAPLLSSLLMHTHSSCQADFHYITPRVFLLQLFNF